MVGESARVLDRTRTAMIVVDMQNGFLSEDGSMTEGGMDITELKNAAMDVARHQGTLLTIQYGFGTVTTTAAIIDSLGSPLAAESQRK